MSEIRRDSISDTVGRGTATKVWVPWVVASNAVGTLCFRTRHPVPQLLLECSCPDHFMV